MQRSEFDKFAEEYHQTLSKSISFSGEDPSFFYEYKVKMAADIAREEQLDVKRILDFGSGVGNSIPFFSKHFPEAQLICADVSRKSLDVSATRFPEAAEYLEIVGDKLALDNDSIDLVFSACVFHHIPHNEHHRWLEQLRRVCREGGMVAIFEHNPWNPLTLKVVQNCPFDENARLIPSVQLRSSLTRSGWCGTGVRYTIFFPRVFASFRPAEKYLAHLPLGAQYVAFAKASNKIA
jgi:ubiquinone/menaquinone biosynthesis C-methylase UbiE